MAEEVKSIRDSAVEAVQKPVETLRQNIDEKQVIVPKPTRHYRAWVFQGYLVTTMIVFVALAFIAKTVAYFTFDVTITHALQSFQIAWFDLLMRGLSWLGFTPQAGIIPVLVYLVLLIIGLKWETVVGGLSLIGSSLLVQIIKSLVDRPRPTSDLVRVISPLNSYSFPSGHVLFFMTFMGFILFLAYTLLKPVWWRTLMMLILSLMILLIGPSRIYEGQHWASDVLGAYLLGSVWLTLTIYVYRWGKTRFFVNQPVAKETPAA